MAWLDDRLWCHPKLVPLSDKAFRVYVNGITYSSGFQLRGELKLAHQKAVGSTVPIKKELVKGLLWDELDGGVVYIHDWEEHNGRRDARRKADTQRKRSQRLNGALRRHVQTYLRTKPNAPAAEVAEAVNGECDEVVEILRDIRKEQVRT